MVTLMAQFGTAYADIIRVVTSPLALAALGLLLGVGVLRLVVRSAKNPTLKLIVHYLFILAVILSVSANLSYVLLARGAQDIRFAGTVVDDKGKGIGSTVVEIAGKGRGITDDYGAFDFTVPRSRADSSYEVSLYRSGYERGSATLSGPQPPNRRFELRELGTRFEDFIAVDQRARMRVFCGLPAIEFSIDMVNPMEDSAIRFEQFKCALKSPKGKQIDLTGEYSAIPPMNARLFGLIPPLEARKNQPNPVFLGFWQFDMRADAFFKRVPQNLSTTLGQALPTSPDLSNSILPKDLVSDMTEFAEKKFAWEPGEWKVSLEFQVRGKRVSNIYRFEVTADDVAQMQKVAEYFKYGAGFLYIRNPMNILALDWRYGEFGDSASDIPVTLTAVPSS